MNRRGFLQSCLALAVAPAIVRADSLMRIIPQEVMLFVPNSEPLLLVPEESFVSFAFAGAHTGRSVAIQQMIRGMVKDGLKYGGRYRDLQIAETCEYDPQAECWGNSHWTFDEPGNRQSGVTLIRARATFNREVPQYADE